MRVFFLEDFMAKFEPYLSLLCRKSCRVRCSPAAAGKEKLYVCKSGFGVLETLRQYGRFGFPGPHTVRTEPSEHELTNDVVELDHLPAAHDDFI